MLDSGVYNVLTRCSKVFAIDDVSDSECEASFIKRHFTIRTVEKGLITYILPNGQRHNTKRDANGFVLPAQISADGGQFWYKDGNCHRDDRGPDGNVLPAKIFGSGGQMWYKNGNRHRDDRGLDGNLLPAIIWSWGDAEWYINDALIKNP
jgi:hypothetical protein